MLRACAILVGVLFLLTSLTASNYSQAEESIIPEWINNIFVWYGQGQVSEIELLQSIEWLIENNVLEISQSSENNDWKEQADKLYKENRGLKGDIDVLEKDYVDALRLIKQLEQRISNLQTSLLGKSQQEYYDSLEETLDSVTKPITTIEDQTIYWDFYDSKGNQYSWSMPVESYEYYVQAQPYLDTFLFELPSGKNVEVVDHTKFVATSFTKVIDDVYDNSGSDEDFIYEVWYITSQLTTYSYDIGEYPRYALETLSRGGGDCEDTAILIADMLKSSKHTENWVIQLVYFDAYNPTNPKDINHVAVSVNTGYSSYVIESTAKTDDGLNAWGGIELYGWWYVV